jgi:hypothetical protein
MENKRSWLTALVVLLMGIGIVLGACGSHCAFNASNVLNGTCNASCVCPNKLNCTENCTSQGINGTCIFQNSSICALSCTNNSTGNCTCPANATGLNYTCYGNSTSCPALTVGSEDGTAGAADKSCPVGKVCKNSTAGSNKSKRCFMD